MSTQSIRTVIFIVLLLHGLGHMGAMIGTIYHHTHGTSGDWLSDRSWLIPGMPAASAKVVACVFWGLAWICFVAAALAYRGILVPTASWPLLGIASAIVSGVGMILFWGSWPLPNTLAAMAINVAVLVGLIWTDGPLQTLLGSSG